MITSLTLIIFLSLLLIIILPILSISLLVLSNKQSFNKSFISYCFEYLNSNNKLGILYPFFYIYLVFFVFMERRKFIAVTTISIILTLISSILKTNMLLFYVNNLTQIQNLNVYSYLNKPIIVILFVLCSLNICFRLTMNFAKLVGNTFVFERPDLLLSLKENSLVLFPRIPEPVKILFNKFMEKGSNSRNILPSNQTWNTGASIAVIGGTFIGLIGLNELHKTRIAAETQLFQTERTNDLAEMNAGLRSPDNYKAKWPIK